MAQSDICRLDRNSLPPHAFSTNQSPADRSFVASLSPPIMAGARVFQSAFSVSNMLGYYHAVALLFIASNSRCTRPRLFPCFLTSGIMRTGDICSHNSRMTSPSIIRGGGKQRSQQCTVLSLATCLLGASLLSSKYICVHTAFAAFSDLCIRSDSMAMDHVSLTSTQC